MTLRDYLVRVVKNRVRGRVIRGGSGGSTYRPPGSRLRLVGDYLAFVGVWGYFFPAFGGARAYLAAGSTGYPSIYPGIDPRANVAVLAFAPVLAVPFVVAAVLSERRVAKLGLVMIGSLGTAVTWPMNEQILSGSVFGVGPLIGLSGGSWLILAGGTLSLLALVFGRWARRYDDDPKTVSR